MDDKDVMAMVLDTLEHIECQFWACDGPALEPVPMATCHRCHTLAVVRQSLGLAPRLPEEMTTTERIERRDQDYMRRAVS